MKHESAEISFRASDGSEYRFFGALDDCESLEEAISKLNEARQQAEEKTSDRERQRAVDAAARVENYKLAMERRLLLNELQDLERRTRLARWIWNFASGLLSRYGMEPKESWDECVARAQKGYAAAPLSEPGDEGLNAPAPEPKDLWRIPY